MTLRPIDAWFMDKDEPDKSCLAFMRSHILKQDDGITEEWKYSMPFYCYRGKMFCYLWIHKKFRQPYLGIVDGNHMHHPDLLQEKRSRMKLLLLDPAKDLPLRKINAVLKEALALRKG